MLPSDNRQLWRYLVGMGMACSFLSVMGED